MREEYSTLLPEGLTGWTQDRHMPIYAFKCDVCGAVFEKHLHMMDDKSSVVCPYGHTKVHQIYVAPHIMFKGPGFYVTDNRAESAIHDIDVTTQA